MLGSVNTVGPDVATLDENGKLEQMPTAADVGLGNVDNTSDKDKPVSTAQAQAIADAKKAGTDARDYLDEHLNTHGNPHHTTAVDVNAVSSDFGWLEDDDLFEWASRQAHSGYFGINPDITTVNVPAPNRWFRGELNVGTGGRVLKLTSTTTGFSDDGAIFTCEYSSNSWKRWKQISTIDNSVLRNGSTAMDGDLSIEKSEPAIRMKNTNKGNRGEIKTGSNRVSIASYNDDSNTEYRTLSLHNALNSTLAQALQLTATTSSGEMDYEVFHTGNKPTNFYDGNGLDEEAHEILLSGIGSAVLVEYPGGLYIATDNGAVAFNLIAKTTTFFGVDEVYYNASQGKLVVLSTNANLNYNGARYYCQLL